jgi:peroxiredoxin (alkyl hydroperoxide reductase subunit C)
MSVLVGRKFPDFCVPAVLADGSIVDNFSLSATIKDKAGVVFFYPLDFTFVCPTELIAFDKRIDEFKKRNVEVVGVSIDSHYTHNAWRNTPVDKGGIGPVRYTLAADLTHEIAKSYGIETPDGAVAYRATFLINKAGMVVHQVVNDLPLGRDVDELLRMVDAMNFHEEHGEVCPAGWKEGEAGMKDSPSGVADYLSKFAAKL